MLKRHDTPALKTPAHNVRTHQNLQRNTQESDWQYRWQYRREQKNSETAKWWCIDTPPPPLTTP